VAIKNLFFTYPQIISLQYPTKYVILGRWLGLVQGIRENTCDNLAFDFFVISYIIDDERLKKVLDE